MWYTGNFRHHNPKLAGILYVIPYSGIAHLKIVGFDLLSSETLRYGTEKVEREDIHMLEVDGKCGHSRAEQMISKEKTPYSLKWKEECPVRVVNTTPSKDDCFIISIQSGNEWLIVAMGSQ